RRDDLDQPEAEGDGWDFAEGLLRVHPGVTPLSAARLTFGAARRADSALFHGEVATCATSIGAIARPAARRRWCGLRRALAAVAQILHHRTRPQHHEIVRRGAAREATRDQPRGAFGVDGLLGETVATRVERIDLGKNGA